jgi:RecB family endonuclease NucS
MPVEMAMWKMTSDGPLAIAPKKLNFEDRLEELVVNDPSLINLSILVIGHQIPTKYGGYIDVLGVDVEGRIHVIELKRDRTPREVVAQILDYGSWAQT